VSSRLALLAAALSGALVAVQQRFNGDLGRSLHDPLLAAVVSFGSGLVIMTLLVARQSAWAWLPQLTALPWWTCIGGAMGATLVAVGATAAPQLGVALLTVGFVSGTTLAALAVDRAGLGPGGHRPLTTPRLAGAGVGLGAIALSAKEGLHAASAGLLALVVLAGALIAVQQALNGRVRVATGPAVATFVNFVVGTTALVAVFVVKAVVGTARADHWPGDWWLYTGGAIGCVFIAVAAALVGQLGVLRFGLAATAGQLLGGVLIDIDRGVSTTTVLAVALTLVAVGVSGLPSRTVAA
jgi:transporter family-2 protein